MQHFLNRTLRTRVATALSALAIFWAVAACQQQTPPASAPENAPATETSAVESKEPILVGLYLSMTGSEATFSQSTENGIQLAVAERNAAGGVCGGRSVVTKTYDTQGKTQEAGTAVMRLITRDKVTALLGEVASGMSIAGGRVAQQYGVPMITPASTNPQVTRIGDMIFRVCFVDPYQGYVVARFATEHLGARRLAVLYDQSQAYSKGLKDHFVAAAEEMGAEVVCEQAYSGGDQDFNAQLATIRETRPEAIFVPGYYTEVGNIARQARQLGLTAPMLGGDGWDSPKLLEIAGEAVEGCFYSNHYSAEIERPRSHDFSKNYKAQYGASPDALAALGYDAAALLMDAMDRAASLDGADLAAAIAATRDFEGVTGRITIDPMRNARKTAVILQIRDGRVRFVTSIEPPTAPPVAPPRTVGAADEDEREPAAQQGGPGMPPMGMERRIDLFENLAPEDDPRTPGLSPEERHERMRRLVERHRAEIEARVRPDVEARPPSQRPNGPPMSHIQEEREDLQERSPSQIQAPPAPLGSQRDADDDGEYDDVADDNEDDPGDDGDGDEEYEDKNGRSDDRDEEASSDRGD